MATNAAESSITVPDCDHVICLGTSKSIEYNEACHRVQLVNGWISKASAIQRAGRTARVRSGTVWRLYSESFHNSFNQYDAPEIQEMPLDHIVLQLRASLGSSITPVLENVMSPPDTAFLSNAFKSLHELRFITRPDDDGELTDGGSVAARLGIDLTLAKLVLHGTRLGLAKEAVCLAAALSQQQMPFRQCSHYVHSAIEVQEILKTTVRGQDHFDAGLNSAPLMLYRILVWWRGGERKAKDCAKFGLVQKRVQQFDVGTTLSIALYPPSPASAPCEIHRAM